MGAIQYGLGQQNKNGGNCKIKVLKNGIKKKSYRIDYSPTVVKTIVRN